MVIKMGGNGAGNDMTIFIFQVFFIGCILKGREIVDIHVARTYHNARRMLTGGSLHPGHSGSQLFNENIIKGEAPVFCIFLYKSIGRLILDACNGTGSEYIVPSEKFFRVFMGHTLVIAGREIEVDIRYLVSIEPKEYGKGDIMTVLAQRRSALRAFLVRQVESAAYGAVSEELAPVAFGADVVRRQWIDFRNA